MATIYHNPKCSKSRKTLALLQENGIEPHIVLYLKTPPTAEVLRSILKKLELQPREIMRQKEPEYITHNLKDTSLSDDALIAAMVAFPSIIERPIVVIDNHAVLGRPPENVLALLNRS